MMNEDLNTIFTKLLSENDALSDLVTDDLIQFGTYVGGQLDILRECYIAFCQNQESYVYQAFLGAPIEINFHYKEDNVIITRDKQYKITLSLENFLIFMGLIDLVYSKILPLGSVIELDTRLFPDQLREMFSHTPGAKVIITGRKLPVADSIGNYLVDYQAQLWPLGGFPPITPMTITNMMIGKVVARGYEDDYEKSFSQKLKQTQLQEKRLSTSFMTKNEAYAFLKKAGGGD